VKETSIYKEEENKQVSKGDLQRVPGKWGGNESNGLVTNRRKRKGRGVADPVAAAGSPGEMRSGNSSK